MKINTYLVLGVVAVAISACATKPEPEPEMAPPVQQAPPPVFTEPEPVPEYIPPAPMPEVEMINPDLPVPGSDEDFAYQSGGEPRVFFGYDQFDLTPEARDVLRRQAAWLSQYNDVRAVIEGHADERGTREYNLGLGARRADSVKAFLVSQGVSPTRLRTISYGKERPIDPRSNNEGWARNRNGTTVIQRGGIG